MGRLLFRPAVRRADRWCAPSRRVITSALPTSSCTPATSTPGTQYSSSVGSVALSMAQMQASRFTPCFSCTYLTALARGKPPRMRISKFSSVPRPEPLPQQKVCSRMVFSGISWNWLQTLRRM